MHHDDMTTKPNRPCSHRLKKRFRRNGLPKLLRCKHRFGPLPTPNNYKSANIKATKDSVREERCKVGRLHNAATRTEYENQLRGKINGRNKDEQQEVITMWEKLRENIKGTADAKKPVV